jgi:uncharacterized cupredoxin-like copper-binding protein
MTAIIAVVALALAAVACGENGDNGDGEHGGGLLVRAENMRFSPDSLVVPLDDEVELTLVNADPVEHDFQIDRIEVDVIAGGAGDGGHGTHGEHHPHGGENVLALHTDVGETQSVTFRALEAGEYEFYCTIPGHRESGMTGTLTVE